MARPATKLKQKEDLRVELAARSVWEPTLVGALSGIGKNQQDLLSAILETLLNRHCGISIQLALELVPLLSPDTEVAPTRVASPVWASVIQRLQRELQATGTPTGMGLLLNTDPAYTLFRLIEPLLRHAQRRVGRVILLCGDEEGGVDSAAYTKWSERLGAAIMDVAQDTDDPELDLFWSERATALAARSRHAAAGSLHLPDSRLAERTAFQRTRAEPARPGEPVARLRPRQASVEQRGSAAEEGFDGIQISRGLDNITSMLHTEYLNHPAVLADRIVNTGYFAFKRFARRESLRHVYLVGVVPPDLSKHALAPFAKACWYEFAVRASHLLARSGMQRSELRWAEGDALGRIRSVDRGLADLSESARRTANLDGFRRHFLHGLQWMPDLLSDRGGLAPELPEEPDPAFALANWLREAWAGDQAEHRLQSFGLVCVNIFVPVSLRRLHGEDGLGILLRSALGFSPDSGRVLTLTWVPNRLDDPEGWEVEVVGSPVVPPRRKAVAGDPALQAATYLQQRWSHGLRKELDRG